MCPRIMYTKVRPGDLVWPLMETGSPIHDDDETVIEKVDKHVPCLCIGLEDTVVWVLLPSMKFGWSYRIFWERAGVDNQEYEFDETGGPSGSGSGEGTGEPVADAVG